MRFNWIVVSLCALGLMACEKKEEPVPEPSSRPAKLLTVSVGKKSFERIFPATSTAGDRAVLGFRVPGELISKPVREGQSVKKGDVLAQLDDQEYGLLRSQAKANFDLANVQLKRMTALIKDKVVSEQDYDQAKANAKSARAQYDQAQANYSYTKLLAPFDGTISIINIENHEHVDANQGVMNIQSTSLLNVIFQLPDSLINRVRGQFNIEAHMVYDSFPQQSFPLTFQEIDTESDVSTGSYKVTMVMERPEELSILPGMSGNIHVILPQTKPSPLPKSAHFPCDDKQCVWKVNGDFQLEKVAVTLNQEGEVLSGLVDGEQIVLSGVSELQAGMKVREWIKERGL